MSVDLYLFVLLYKTNIINKHQYSIIFFIKRTINKKSPHFPLRIKVSQLRKCKRLLCWSSYIISLCCQPSSTKTEPIFLTGIRGGGF